MKKVLLILVTILILAFSCVGAFASETGQNDTMPMESVEDSTQSTITEISIDDSNENLSHEEGKFATAGDLYQYWMATRVNYETSPYPSYICGVYSTDGGMENMTFAVTKDEAGEAGKAEILALVSDVSTVAFTYQSYPYAELWEIQLELTDHLGVETGANSLGIEEMRNVLVVGVDEKNENSEAFMRKSFEIYGDMIKFEQNDGIILDASDFGVIQPVGGLDKGSISWYFLISLIMILCISVFLLLRHRLAPAMQTNTGSIVTNPGKISTHQVKEMVRGAKISPSKELDVEILSKVEKMQR